MDTHETAQPPTSNPEPASVPRHRSLLLPGLLILAAVALFGAIATILVTPRFGSDPKQARITAAQTQLLTFKTALEAFSIDAGRYPTSDEGLAALVRPPRIGPHWNGPYLQGAVPLDPWGNPYVYHCPGQHNPNGFDVYSLGPTGQEGGDTINNWSGN